MLVSLLDQTVLISFGLYIVWYVHRVLYLAPPTQAIRQSMASVLPDEPATDCAEKTSTLRIRLPDGSTAQRRFLAKDTLQVRPP